MEYPKRDEFDLFISYAHADDRGAHPAGRGDLAIARAGAAGEGPV
jgi:hypothetical protein